MFWVVKGKITYSSFNFDLLQAEEEFPPPPPERSTDNSFNDSNSTTQSNVTSECSEAECDREPLVKQRGQPFF